MNAYKIYIAGGNDAEGYIEHDKQEDVEKNREEISKIIEQEIVSRYYFQSGKIEASFQNDLEIQKALEVLEKPSVVSDILNGTFKASNETLKK